MKRVKLYLIAAVIGILLGVTACNLFDDDYVWNDWVTAIIK